MSGVSEDMTTEGLSCDRVPEETIASLLAVIEDIDADGLRTADHCEAVAGYAAAIGRRLGFDAARLRRLRRCAILHDIGKSEVPAQILAKPGPLSSREREVIEGHPEAGADILCRAGLFQEAAVVRAHHERFDGRGYPDGLAGDAIPLEARVVFVADAFAAMTSDRPYQAGRTGARALAELRRCAGTQFDPHVVEALAAGAEKPRAGRGTTGRARAAA